MGLGIRVNHQSLTNLEIFIWYELTELALWKLEIGFLVPKQKEKIWLSKFYFWKSGHFVVVSESHSVVSDSLWPHGLYSSWNSPDQNTGVGSLPLPQGIFPTQGSNPGLPHCRWILYQLSHKGSPKYWSGYTIPCPVDLPDPGIEPGSPAVQVDSLPTELLGNPILLLNSSKRSSLFI